MPNCTLSSLNKSSHLTWNSVLHNKSCSSFITWGSNCAYIERGGAYVCVCVCLCNLDANNHIIGNIGTHFMRRALVTGILCPQCVCCNQDYKWDTSRDNSTHFYLSFPCRHSRGVSIDLRSVQFWDLYVLTLPSVLVLMDRQELRRRNRKRKWLAPSQEKLRRKEGLPETSNVEMKQKLSALNKQLWQRFTHTANTLLVAPECTRTCTEISISAQSGSRFVWICAFTCTFKLQLKQ